MNTETISLNTLSDRLNYALELTGTRKADLARAIAVKPQIIQFLCGSQTQSSRFTFEIATALGLSTRWLATGEGEMFVADDPRQQFLKAYKSVPLLHNITDVFLNDNPFNQQTIKEWLPLKTQNQDIFAIEMPDTSMDPVFPINSYLFIKKISEKNYHGYRYILSYLVKFNAFVIRELIENESEIVLAPKNTELFKEISVTDDVKIVGVVTDSFWHMRD